MSFVRRHAPDTPKHATKVSVNADLLAEARELDVDLSNAAEAGIARAVAQRHADLWLEENRAALESSNAYVRQNGLPLAGYRRF